MVDKLSSMLCVQYPSQNTFNLERIEFVYSAAYCCLWFDDIYRSIGHDILENFFCSLINDLP